MLDTFVTVCSLVLALAFAWAGLLKLLRFRAWLGALDRYGLPPAAVRGTAISVPLVELAVATVLAFGPVRIGAATTIFLLALFSLAILRARMLEGDKVPCGCFGGTAARDYWVMITRNVLLGVLAAFVLLLGASAGRVDGIGPELLPALLAFAGVIAALFFVRSFGTSLKKGARS